MIKFIRNIPWKEVGIIILLGALALGAIVGISSALTTKTKTISPLIFAKGSYDNEGVFVESDRSITNKDYIECQGLKIEPAYNATGTYQVFYFSSNKQFIGATEIFKAAETRVYEKGNSFAFAKYCRIVITPDVPKDEYGFVEQDYKIKFYEVAGIASKYTITTRKNQSMSFEGLTNYAEKFALVEDSIYVINAENNPVTQTVKGKSTTTIALSTFGSDSIGLVFDNIPSNCTYIVANKSNVALTSGTLDVSDRSLVFNMPAGGELLILNFDSGCAPAIYHIK